MPHNHSLKVDNRVDEQWRLQPLWKRESAGSTPVTLTDRHAHLAKVQGEKSFAHARSGTVLPTRPHQWMAESLLSFRLRVRILLWAPCPVGVMDSAIPS